MTIVSFLFDTAKNNIPYLMDLLLKADFYRLLETLATVVIYKSHLAAVGTLIRRTDRHAIAGTYDAFDERWFCRVHHLDAHPVHIVYLKGYAP